MKSISTIIQSIDFDYSFKLMALLDRIRRGDSLDELLHDYSFVFVYQVCRKTSHFRARMNRPFRSKDAKYIFFIQSISQ